MRFSIPMLCALVLAAAPLSGAHPSELHVTRGVTASGEATPLWLEIVRRRAGDEGVRAVQAMPPRPFSAQEEEWAALIAGRLPFWQGEAAELAGLWSPAAPPARVGVVVGNRGASDAFTHDPQTIGFDLSALLGAYGPASLPANRERIDRLFRHEYTHLMQKSWLRDRPWETRSPQRAAVLGIWLEGLGNYYSMSEPWRSAGGALSPKAAEALASLEPRLVARLAALACAEQRDVPALMAELSEGKFDRKWGGLTAALWIDRETSRDPAALRRLVLDGPDGIWPLAARHLQPPLAAALREAREAAALCNGE